MMRMHRWPRFLLLLLLALLVSGCADTRKIMRFSGGEQVRVWPSAPEPARYRFVGELTGEGNFEALEKDSAASRVRDFFSAIVGLGSKASFQKVLQRPQSGVVDAAGRILVTDASRLAIFVFDQTAGTLSVWDQASKSTNFASPVGIAVAANGDILVADSELARVFRLSPEGKPLAVIGLGDLARPTGLAIDTSSGRIYVADTSEHNIKVFTDNGRLVDIFGRQGTGKATFNAPTHLSFRGGRLYVTDTFNARVQVLDSAGGFLRSLGERGLYVGNLVRPKGVAADSEGNIYVIESFHDYLLIYDADGRFLLPIGGTGSGIGQFYLPAGVWVDSHDRIYVADMFNGRVMVFQYLAGNAQIPEEH